jgi:hypothetical protein
LFTLQTTSPKGVVAKQAEPHCGKDGRRKAIKKFKHEAHEEEKENGT